MVEFCFGIEVAVCDLVYDVETVFHLGYLLTTSGNLTAVTGVGSSPAMATCETSQVLLAGVSGGFPGVFPFRPTFRLACLDMSEIILKGTLN